MNGIIREPTEQEKRDFTPVIEPRRKESVKEKFMREYCPDGVFIEKGQCTGVTVKGGKFISDLNELLRETAEAQKAAVLNQFAKDWKWAEIHPKAVECVNNTPLVTSPNTGDKK